MFSILKVFWSLIISGRVGTGTKYSCAGGDAAYVLSDSKLLWDQGHGFCAEMGLALVKFDTQAVYEDVVEIGEISSM